MVDELYVTSRNDWRGWLEKYGASRKEVWLICFKRHTGKSSIPYEDSLEEAICFGWIDGVIKRLDDERCARKFMPRKNRSKWSDSNKKRAEKMIKTDRMTDIGMAKIEEAKKNGEWFKSNAVEKDISLPSFIEKALINNETANENFSNMAPSYKRLYVRWITSAKREETRLRRLEEAISLLEQNKKLGLK